MSTAATARELIEEIAGPVPLARGYVKTALEAVARKTGLSHRRVRGLWNNEARRIDADEIKALREAARRKEAISDGRSFEAFADRLAALESRLAQIDEAFFGEDLAALRALSGRVRNVAE